MTRPPALLAATLLAIAAATALTAPAGTAQARNPLTEVAPSGTSGGTSGGLSGGSGSRSGGAARPERQAPAQAPDRQAPGRETLDRGASRAGGTDLDATAIIRSLAPFANGNPGAPRDVDTGSGRVTVDYARAIDLTIFFAYDSAAILPEALPQVDRLAQALDSPQLAAHRFLLAGHTDAKGRAGYNLDLSRRRAMAIARYLVDAHGIAPDRLVAWGWGETRLKVPSDPLSGANRRVEVALIVPREASSLDGPIEDLVDPRDGLGAFALDDFDAAPTPINR